MGRPRKPKAVLKHEKPGALPKPAVPTFLPAGTPLPPKTYEGFHVAGFFKYSKTTKAFVASCAAQSGYKPAEVLIEDYTDYLFKVTVQAGAKNRTGEIAEWLLRLGATKCKSYRKQVTYEHLGDYIVQ